MQGDTDKDNANQIDLPQIYLKINTIHKTTYHNRCYEKYTL